ncbi:MAG TPA: hypothetical protein VGL97_22565 [Bryobacteraceae bacterium]
MPWSPGLYWLLDGKYSYEYDGRGREAKVWTYNEFDGSNTLSSVTIYEYVDDEIGNWIEQRKRHLWRNDSYESNGITTRKLSYPSP